MNRLLAPIRRFHRFRSLRRALKGAPARHIEPELLYLKELLYPGRAFLDVGANIGEYAYAAMRYLPQKNIYAFEPQATYVRDLKAFFPRITVLRCALSDRSGEARLKIPRIGEVLYRTRGTLEKFQEPGESGAEFEAVPMMTLDEAAQKLGIGPVGCIKIDVEGHELPVLRGAEGVLERDHPALIIEIEQRHHGEPIERIFQFLAEQGYAGYFLDPASKELAPIADFSVAQYQQEALFKTEQYVRNFIFIHHA
ncbi:MAG TPA: FkbM family methyltransferase [Candidatus Paceibacterota bacterium]|nr:FkbM family methyltransferase [Candidatus Paceibacterota bacterium]